MKLGLSHIAGRLYTLRATQKQIQESQLKVLIFTKVYFVLFSPANLNLKNKGQYEIVPSSLDREPQIEIQKT